MRQTETVERFGGAPLVPYLSAYLLRLPAVGERLRGACRLKVCVADPIEDVHFQPVVGQTSRELQSLPVVPNRRPVIAQDGVRVAEPFQSLGFAVRLGGGVVIETCLRVFPYGLPPRLGSPLGAESVAFSHGSVCRGVGLAGRGPPPRACARPLGSIRVKAAGY